MEMDGLRRKIFAVGWMVVALLFGLCTGAFAGISGTDWNAMPFKAKLKLASVGSSSGVEMFDVHFYENGTFRFELSTDTDLGFGGVFQEDTGGNVMFAPDQDELKAFIADAIVAVASDEGAYAEVDAVYLKNVVGKVKAKEKKGKLKLTLNLKAVFEASGSIDGEMGTANGNMNLSGAAEMDVAGGGGSNPLAGTEWDMESYEKIKISKVGSDSWVTFVDLYFGPSADPSLGESEFRAENWESGAVIRGTYSVDEKGKIVANFNWYDLETAIEDTISDIAAYEGVGISNLVVQVTSVKSSTTLKNGKLSAKLSVKYDVSASITGEGYLDSKGSFTMKATGMQ